MSAPYYAIAQTISQLALRPMHTIKQ